TTLVAALKVCLLKYTSNDLVAVGSPALIDLGHPNALVIASEMKAGMSFRDLLLAVRESLLAAYRRQRYPFGRLVRDLGLEIHEGKCPLFEVAISLAGMHGEMPVANNITMRVEKRQDGMSAAIEYNSEMYLRESIERFSNHFMNVLDNALRSTTAIIEEIEMMAEPERDCIVRVWNETARGCARGETLHAMFEEQAEKNSESIAVSGCEEEISFEGLNRRANQLARYLRRRGVGPESLVGICVERSVDMVAGLLAVLKAGGAYVPLDKSYPAERLAYMIEDAGLKLILTQEQFAGRLRGQEADLICLDSVQEVVRQESEENLCCEVSGDNLAYLIYTSGSTGRPKGAMITHRGVVNYLSWCATAYDVTGGKGAPLHSPIGFDLTVTSLFAPLVSGKSVAIVKESEGLEGLCASLSESEDFSLVKITPAHLDLLGNMLAADRIAGATRALVVGGEALFGESLRVWRDQSPGVRIINEYGPTETVVGCCAYEVPAGNPASGPVPIGRPIDNTQIYLLDDRLRPVAIGLPGELYVGGDGVARGYLNRPGLTAERFIPDPFKATPGARLYKTGDLARYQFDGTIHFLGRLDDQVKIRGFRIELGEIESVLSQHSCVQAVAVTVREDTPGDRRLVAYVASDPAQAALASELRSFVKEKLPEYMIPAAFVLLDSLPLTPNGKIDRRALPAPESNRPGLKSRFVAPHTPLEEMLAALWEQVLAVEHLGVNDNFFELGGHSLLATQLISRVSDAFNVALPLRTLFEAPTIAGLAQVIETAIKEGQGLKPQSIKRASREKALPLSFAQQRLWFLDQLEPGKPFFNIPAAIRFSGGLDVLAFEKVFTEIIRRHESLRTRFASADGKPVQVIDAPRPFVIPVIDLDGLPEAQQQAESERLADEEAKRPFDLGRGPLLRVS
ncbi:MAG TPA: amino acid adenylation domain-containing protein, partial [Blastocatellia bacterium]